MHWHKGLGRRGDAGGARGGGIGGVGEGGREECGGWGGAAAAGTQGGLGIFCDTLAVLQQEV